MSVLPNCPKCDSSYTYQDGVMSVCPECAHEWNMSQDNDIVDEGGVVMILTATPLMMAIRFQ